MIASAKRRQLLDELVLPSVVAQSFDECVVVGDFHSGAGWRHLPFRPLTGSTIDALFKRDVGTVATSSDWLFYLCDDHRVHPDFSQDLLQFMQETPLGPKGFTHIITGMRHRATVRCGGRHGSGVAG